MGSWRTEINFNQALTEEQFERDHEMTTYANLKKKLLKMFDDVFKEDLDPRIDSILIL